MEGNDNGETPREKKPRKRRKMSVIGADGEKIPRQEEIDAKELKRRQALIIAHGIDPCPAAPNPRWLHKYGAPIHAKDLTEEQCAKWPSARRAKKAWEEEKKRNRQQRQGALCDLSPEHADVVHNYFRNGGNKKQACIDAGYSKGFSPQNIFDRPEVKHEIARRRKRLMRNYEVTEDRVMKELSSVAFTGMNDFLKIDKKTGRAYLDVTNATAEQLAAITRLKITPAGVQFDLSEKMNALDKLARIKGMYEDTVTVLGGEDAVAKLQAGRARMNKRREEKNKK